MRGTDVGDVGDTSPHHLALYSLCFSSSVTQILTFLSISCVLQPMQEWVPWLSTCSPFPRLFLPQVSWGSLTWARLG